MSYLLNSKYRHHHFTNTEIVNAKPREKPYRLRGRDRPRPEVEWRIPATRMKMRTPHFAPLSSQAVEILRELQPLTGSGRFVFPGERSRDRPMSNNTVNAALCRLGYTNAQMTGHGLRSMASTLLNEQGWHPDAIERQLVHQEPNEIRAAYNYAKHLPERRKMMQAWSDYLYRLRSTVASIPPNDGKLVRRRRFKTSPALQRNA
ncbi:MAG: tyrosine-type recombinase/integrase [Acidobacteriaceae bacterium]